MLKNSLAISNLSCSRNDRTLFSNLNFSLQDGQVVQITGANGTGKTTLLKILAGLLLPETGAVQWNNAAIKQTDYHMHMTYLGHKIGVKSGLTVLENLQLALALTASKVKINLEQVLAQLQLDNYLHVLIQNLSTGQRQRLALARLFISNAKLWILDEPFTALDIAGREVMQTCFLNHLKQDGMIVFTSHQTIALLDSQLQQINL